MNADRSFDDRLAARVRSLGLGDAASTLLEACAPLAWVGAQLGIMIEPLFGPRGPGQADLLGLLESPDRMSVFIHSLHQGPPA